MYSALSLILPVAWSLLQRLHLNAQCAQCGLCPLVGSQLLHLPVLVAPSTPQPHSSCSHSLGGLMESHLVWHTTQLWHSQHSSWTSGPLVSLFWISQAIYRLPFHLLGAAGICVLYVHLPLLQPRKYLQIDSEVCLIFYYKCAHYMFSFFLKVMVLYSGCSAAYIFCPVL